MQTKDRCKLLCEPNEVVAKLKAWVDSPEGKKALAESQEKANAVKEQMRKCRKISWELMHKPVTI